MKKRKIHNGRYTINIRKLFKETVNSQFRREKDDNGKILKRTAFDEIMFFIEQDLKDAFLSIEAIAHRHDRRSILPEDVVEYYGIVGRPKLYEEE